MRCVWALVSEDWVLKERERSSLLQLEERSTVHSFIHPKITLLSTLHKLDIVLVFGVSTMMVPPSWCSQVSERGCKQAVTSLRLHGAWGHGILAPSTRGGKASSGIFFGGRWLAQGDRTSTQELKTLRHSQYPGPVPSYLPASCRREGLQPQRWSIRQETEIKGIQIGKKEGNGHRLIYDGHVLYIGSPKFTEEILFCFVSFPRQGFLAVLELAL